MQWEALSFLAVITIVLWFLHRRHQRAVSAERLAVYNGCLPLFEAYRLTQDDTDFPVLAGRYRSHDIRLEPICDHLVVRKVPSLWLLVTISGKIPFTGIMDYLARPQNTEFYSLASRLHVDIRIPPDWPQHGWLRSDQPDRMPPIDLITPHMSFFDDPKAKELVVTPRGVRLVYQATQGVRAHYMVLRQARFESVVFSQETVRNLLDLGIALYESLTEEEHPVER